MNFSIKISRILIFKLLVFSLITAAVGQDVKSGLFNSADEAFQAALTARADVLAPSNYSNAKRYYDDADKQFKEGKNLEDIRTNLQKSVSSLLLAVDATKLAEVTLTSAIQSRNDAVKARAAEFSKDSWSKAEDKFAEAASGLEGGDVNKARGKGAEAETLYREAELDAIKNHYLTETRSLIKEADDKDVKKYAPETLADAKQLLKQADETLSTNRYDFDKARTLAQQANYQAHHSLYIYQISKGIKDKKQSVEKLILSSEMPLKDIAQMLNVPADFSNGSALAAKNITDRITEAQNTNAALTQDVSRRRQQIADLEKEIAELQSKLASTSEQESDLKKRLALDAEIKQKFESVNKIFTAQEATVLRQGNNIILRLVGLNFASGKTDIAPKNFSILTKVQNAIRTFPNSSFVVEGHTDSYGTDQANLSLSRARADAVKEYLAANMDLTRTSIKAVGYGETRPVASNDKEAGRTMNRRIDILITPNL